jgi:AcrR family transcriptional regulator
MKTRDTMIDGARLLLAEKGLQDTSFSEVLARTGAPRGSIYHHFPHGKDQLIGLAVERAGESALDVMEGTAGRPAAEIVDTFLGLWRTLLDRAGFRMGCAVLAVTVATDDAALLDRTAAVFRAWRDQLTRLLEQGGMPAARAAGFAALLIAATEGAVAMARAERAMDPFDLVAEDLRERTAELTAP